MHFMFTKCCFFLKISTRIADPVLNDMNPSESYTIACAVISAYIVGFEVEH